MSDSFSPHIEATSRHFFGEPNRALSNRRELRFGAQGSMSVDLEAGTWFDHEAKEGGGVLALIEREAKVKNGGRLQYLREQVGVDLPHERPATPMPKDRGKSQRIVATYDYTDEYGELLFQVVRMEPKDFRQRRKAQPTDDPSRVRDGWCWSVKGVRQVPYRLVDLMDAIDAKLPVYVVEGEKDADALWALGVPATCNAGGASKWPLELAACFGGADVVILPDNDDAGRAHRDLVGSSLREVAASVTVLELPGLPAKGDVSDWLAAGGSAEDLQALTGVLARPWRPAPPVSRYGAVQWHALASIEPRRDWTVRGLMFPRDLGLIYGESGAGKSFLGVDLGLSIAQGKPFFGMDTKPGPIAYQAGEGQGGLISRLHAYGVRHGVRDADLPFVLMTSRVNLYSEDPAPFIDELRLWAAWYGRPLSAVFVDTLSAASAGANENASEDVSRIIGNGKEIKEATGSAVILVHHKNAGGTKARGHTSLYADADFAMDVSVDEETRERTFRLAKVKDGEAGQEFGFRLQPVEIGSDDDGKSITSCVIDPAQDVSPRTSDRTKPAYLPTGQSLFLNVLDDAISQYGGVVPPNSTAPSRTHGVEWSPFVRLYKTIRGVTHEDNAIRQALIRDGDALAVKGFIGKDNPWVWITDAGRAYLRERRK